MTKAQEVYERVEALVAQGARKADAFRQAAEEFGQPFNSMRGSYYAHTRTLTDTPARPRKRQAATLDPIESATIVLTNAIATIDAEIDAAKTRAETAQAEYEKLRDSAEERKTTLQTKIDALNS